MKKNCHDCAWGKKYSFKKLILNNYNMLNNDDTPLEDIFCCKKADKADHPLGFHCHSCHRTFCVFCGHFQNKKDKNCCVYKCWIRCGCKVCHKNTRKVA